MPHALRQFLTAIVSLVLLAFIANPLGAQNPAPPPANPTSPMQTGTIVEFDVDSVMAASAASAVQWSDLKVEGFDPGAKLAVIHGDPSGNGDYTVRLQFPDGYRFPVHWHPKAEHVTVLSGGFILGMGGTVNAANEKTYGPGDFLYIPAAHPHSGGARGVTVIQLHGIGPFAINLGIPRR